MQATMLKHYAHTMPERWIDFHQLLNAWQTIAFTSHTCAALPIVLRGSGQGAGSGCS